MDPKRLIKEAHEVAISKGWYDTEVFFSDHIANIHAELSEAWEEYRNNRGLNEIYFECKYIKTGACDNVGDNGECKGADCKHAKPCGIPVELADVCIRIFDTFGNKNINPEEYSMIRFKKTDDSFAAFVNLIHKYLSKAEGEHQKENIAYFPIMDNEYLYTVIGEIEDYCKDNNIDLEKAIELKMAYNKTRPYRHGGKKI